jgi:type II secretory pathway predicted ATPase ExeA
MSKEFTTERSGPAVSKIFTCRDQEIAALGTLLRDCARGQGTVAVIRGPVASGKTTLLRALAEQATADAVFLDAYASRAECGLPLGVVNQLMRGRSCPAAIAPQVTGRALSPALVRVFDRVLGFLTELSQDCPVVVAVDDLHYADVASLQFLAYLARRVGTMRMLLVVTEGTHALPSDRLLHAEILRQGRDHCFPLAPLPPSSVARLLAEHIDPEAAQHLAPACRAITGGSPALVRALGEDFRTSGEPAAGLVPRTAFRSAVVTCLHSYEPGLVELGQAVAILDEHATSAVLGELLAIDPESAERGLDALGASGLLESGRFRHEQARQAVLGQMTADERKALHASAARTLYRTGAGAATLARHLTAGHRTGSRWAVAALQGAAGQALADGEAKRAIDYLRRAESECTDDRQHAAVMFALVRAEWPLDPEYAARHLPELVANARAGMLDSTFLGELSHYLLWMGDTKNAAEIFAALESGTAVSGPVRAAHHMAIRSALDFLYPEAAGRVRDTKRSARAAESMLAERSTVDPTLTSITTALMAMICEGMLDRAAWWCEVLLREADAPGGSPLWNAMLTAFCAMIETRRGNFAAAEGQARKALSLLTTKAWGVAIGAPLSSLLLSATASRHYDDAAACLRMPVPEAMSGTLYGLLYTYARGEYHLATGRPQTALGDFTACGNRMTMWRLDLPGLVPWQAKADAAHLALDNRRCRCHSLALLTASSRDTAPSLTKMFLRCRFTVASVSCRREAIWPLLRACATRSSTSSSRADSVPAEDPGWV